MAPAALREFFDRLTYEGYRDRVNVIMYAADNDGFVDAETVYQLCDYEDDRTLRGLTKPVKRISLSLLKDPVPDDAVQVRSATYATGQQRAIGFEVPKVLISMIKGIMDSGDDEVRLGIIRELKSKDSILGRSGMANAAKWITGSAEEPSKLQ